MLQMKKTLWVAALAISAHAGHAQTIAAGTVSLGGIIGYGQSSSKSSAMNSRTGGQNVNSTLATTGWQLYLVPAVSYFVTENLAMGVAVGYANSGRVEDAAYVPSYYTMEQHHSQYRTSSLRAGAFAQYYQPLNAQFGLTGRLGAGYQRQHEQRDGYSIINATTHLFSGAYTSQGYYAELTPGIVFFPVPKLGLSATMGALTFNHLSLTDSYFDSADSRLYAQDADSNDFAANFGLNFFQLGGTYYFGR